MSTEAIWRPKAVIFDLLTALLDSWTLWDASTPTGTTIEGRRWRHEYLAITFGQGAYVPYEDMVRRAAVSSGMPDSAPANLLGNWDTLQAWKEVPKVLGSLKQQGFKLGVVTNCSIQLGRTAALCAAKNVAGVDAQDIWDTIVTAEESGFYKPRKEAYQAILDAMGVDASEALFVAGSAGDVQGATDVGMRVVWHNQVGLPPKGEATPLREGKTLDEALQDYL